MSYKEYSDEEWALLVERELLNSELNELSKRIRLNTKNLALAEIKIKTKAARNKAKGSIAENYIIHKLIELDEVFKFAKTTRSSDKQLDSCGIDINHIPFIVQSKAGQQKGLQPMEVIRYIDAQRIVELPPDSKWHGMIRVVVKVSDPGVGVRRSEYHDSVHMTLEDFLKLVKLAFSKTPSNG